MKIILYANRNTGECVLSYLLAKGHKVKVITDEDEFMTELCKFYGVKIVTLDTMGEFDLFICCHGRKIIDKKYLVNKKFINIHPCLYKYKGHNPIRKYIKNQDTLATVEAQFMIEEIDGGEVIHAEAFETPVCNSYAEFYNIALPYYFKCIHNALIKYENIIDWIRGE